MNKKFVMRGDVWTTDLGRGMGSEHQGVKYCLVVQNDIGNQHSGTTVVIPLSKVNKHMPTHVEIKNVLPSTSYVVCEQIRVVDMSRLKNRVARIDSTIMEEVEKAIRLQLGM